MSKTEKLVESLKSFKDWSNYLLVTTVASLGWVASEKGPKLPNDLLFWIVWSLALSIVFAILTLAPLVAEKITDDTSSIYDVRASFHPF